MCALIALIVVACGGGSTLDTDEVQRALEEDLVADPEVDVGRVDCPGTVERRAGATFECTVSVDGQPLVVTVRQTDAEGTVELEPQRQVLLRTEVEAEVARQVAAEIAGGVAADRTPGAPGVDGIVASCDDRTAFVVAAGDRLSCTVTRGPHAALTVEVEVGDDGALTIRPT